MKTDGFAAFSTEVAKRVRDVAAVTTAVPMRFADASVGGDVKTVGSVDPATIDRVVDLQFTSGSARGLARQGVLVADELAHHLGVTTGDQLPVQFSQTSLPLTVRGVYRQQNFIGIFGQSVPLLVAPETMEVGTGGAPAGLARARTDRRRRHAPRPSVPCAPTSPTTFPTWTCSAALEFRSDQQAQIDQFLAVLIVILTLSEIIAILGIVNTLALSVFERTRELGLLRVVGMSRRQVRRMVRWESVVIAVLGGVVGIAFGVLWGWAFSRAPGTGHHRVPDPVARGAAVRGRLDARGRAGGRVPGVAGFTARRARRDCD